jgi:hypothetical protein
MKITIPPDNKAKVTFGTLSLSHTSLRQRTVSNLRNVYEIIVFTIIISDSAILVRALADSHQRYHNIIKILGRTPLDERSARHKGLYLNTKTQHRKTRTSIHALSGIRTHDLIVQAIETYASDRAPTGTGGIIVLVALKPVRSRKNNTSGVRF